MINEIKFLLFLILFIFLILLLIFIINYITYIKFNCNETLNFLKSIPYSGTIYQILPYLQTGDIILFTNNPKIIKNKKDCYLFSRYMFTPKNYSFQHIGLIYRTNNNIFLIESSFPGGNCIKQNSLSNKNYNQGLKIVDFKEYINSYHINSPKHSECIRHYGIRFINRNINQNILNKRLSQEYKILDNTQFNYNKTIVNALIGWSTQDIPLKYKHGFDSLLPQNEPKDTYFCSDAVGTLLQRCGIMKKQIRPSIFFPSYFSGFMDKDLFYPNTYSKLYMFK